MKTIILNSSPIKDGNTLFLINELTNKLNGEIEIINLYEKNIHPCVDCRACFSESRCVIKDDAMDILEALRSCDNIVIASPLHYNQPTAVYLTLASRFQAEYAAKNKGKSKAAAVILCGGGDCVVNSADAEKTIRITLMSINAKVVAYARSLHTSTLPASEDKTAIDEINNMAEILNTLGSPQ
jgi:multimeric flavodoxin WrbA